MQHESLSYALDMVAGLQAQHDANPTAASADRLSIWTDRVAELTALEAPAPAASQVEEVIAAVVASGELTVTTLRAMQVVKAMGAAAHTSRIGDLHIATAELVGGGIVTLTTYKNSATLRHQETP